MEPINSDAIEILPFEVNYNGPAPIKTYFLVQTGSKPSESVAHFRGRKIIGKEIALTDGITAAHAVIGEKTGLNEGQVLNHYSKLRLWQHDHAPDTSQVQECLNWMEIAQAVSFHFISIFSTLSDNSFAKNRFIRIDS